MNKQLKRLLALFLAILMVVSMAPMSVFAATGADEQNIETEEGSGTATEMESKPFEETLLVKEVKSNMDALLNKYLGTTIMSEEDVQNIVFDMDGDTFDNAYLDSCDIIEAAEEMTDAEKYFIDIYPSTNTFRYLWEAMNEFLPPISFFKTVSVLDGKVSLADTASSISVSGNTVTVTAKGSLFSKKTNTVTITNNSGEQKQLSFSYNASSANSFKIDGASASTSGMYSKLLAAGASVKFEIQSKSGLSGTTATLTLSGFELASVSTSSNVTFAYDDALGSITVAGEAVANGAVKELSLSEGATLVATPNSGTTFLGWLDGENMILSTDTTYTIKPTADTTVTAAFATNDGTGTAWFSVGSASQKSQSSGLLGLGKLYYYQVGTSYLFNDVNAAGAKAASDAANKTLVLMNNATLPAGNYTIPAGVTVLIPFDSANTMYTTQAAGIEHPKESGVADTLATPYRTLTMESGANLVLNGSMSLSAKH